MQGKGETETQCWARQRIGLQQQDNVALNLNRAASSDAALRSGNAQEQRFKVWTRLRRLAGAGLNAAPQRKMCMLGKRRIRHAARGGSLSRACHLHIWLFRIQLRLLDGAEPDQSGRRCMGT